MSLIFPLQEGILRGILCLLPVAHDGLSRLENLDLCASLFTFCNFLLFVFQFIIKATRHKQKVTNHWSRSDVPISFSNPSMDLFQATLRTVCLELLPLHLASTGLHSAPQYNLISLGLWTIFTVAPTTHSLPVFLTTSSTFHHFIIIHLKILHTSPFLLSVLWCFIYLCHCTWIECQVLAPYIVGQSFSLTHSGNQMMYALLAPT